MPKSLYYDPMKTVLSLAAANKEQHQTDHGRINKAVFILLAVLCRFDRGVWHFQFSQEFTLPTSARVKR
jgi:hypothetical protein